MGILDSGNQVLCPGYNHSSKPPRDKAYITISKKLIKLSAEAPKAMDNPKYIEFWFEESEKRQDV